jgi:hypothetical protein
MTAAVDVFLCLAREDDWQRAHAPSAHRRGRDPASRPSVTHKAWSLVTDCGRDSATAIPSLSTKARGVWCRPRVGAW